MDDEISNLPDEVLFHILSFLPTEDVLVTSLVSKRWKPLWLSVTNLDLDKIRCSRRDTCSVRSLSSFIKFVDASILRRGIHQPIKTLRFECSLQCPVFKLNKWLKAAADCKVENLQFNCSANWQDLPCTIFSIKTLVVLKLKWGTFKDFSSVELPLLKTLHLDYVTFSKCQHFADLLNGCPLLENLEAKCISAAFVDDPKFTTLSKLVRADVFNLRPFDIPMRTFCNVEFLRIDEFCDVDIPIFPNLIQLELMFGRHDLKWESVLDMLNHCPQLQTFDLENPSYTADKVWPNTHVVPKCFSSQLRTCILRNFKGKESGMRFAKFVMQNSALLDTMTIFSYRHLSLEEILEMRKELDSCPRSSASCELLFKNLKPLSKLVRADLSPWMMKRLGIYNIDEFVREFCDGADIPIFPNLFHFELILVGFVKMEAVLYLLNHCPQLQTFVLVVNSSNKVWPNTPLVPECFSSQLQTCTITKFEGEECEITFAKFVMQNSTSLRKMTIFGYHDLNLYLSDKQKAEIRIELESCPKSSTTCELSLM